MNNKVFLTKWSEVSGGRFDPLYFKSVDSLSIVKKTVYPVSKLSEVINMQRGRFGHRPRNAPHLYNGEYPFIQTGDIVRSSETSEPISFSQTLNESGLKTSRLFSEPVVVLTIAANIGDTAILDYPACFPDSLIGLTPKTNELTLSYINLYFKFIKNYLNALAPQAAQKNINYQQLTSVPIIVPPINRQIAMTKLYEQALLTKQKAEEEAKQLLESIDDYLLGELGITLPKEASNDITQRIFTRKWSKISGERADPFWYSNQSFSICGGCFGNKKLSAIAHIYKGQSISSSQIIDGVYPVVAGGQISPYNHNIYNEEGNVITVSASGAYSGFVWYHTDKIFASDCSVIRSMDESTVTTVFLFEILKLKQNEIYRLQQGAGQPHVYRKDLAKLKIPLPPLKKQNEIASHITAIRQKAKALQENALSDFEKAKAEVEKMILG